MTVTGQEPQDQQVFRFRTGVELINVTATVTDANGRFVSGLRKEDFRLSRGRPGAANHSFQQRARAGEPRARGRHERQHGGREDGCRRGRRSIVSSSSCSIRDDEVFLYRFDNQPELVEAWTNDQRAHRDGARAHPAPRGHMRSTTRWRQPCRSRRPGAIARRRSSSFRMETTRAAAPTVREVKPLIRSTEVLAYAIGIDTGLTHLDVGRSAAADVSSAAAVHGCRSRFRFRFLDAGARRVQPPSNPPMQPRQHQVARPSDDRLNVAALRDITDDSGGRTEIVRYARDLDPATSGIADELSRRSYLGYSAQGREGRTVAHDPRGTAERTRTWCARARDTSRCPDRHV